jgi:hypothetical protein
MKRLISLAILASVLYAGTVLAADPIVGSWKLDVQKSKFGGKKISSGTRVYTEAAGVYTLDEKFTTADGKELTRQAHYSDGKEVPDGGDSKTSTRAKKITENTWDFEGVVDGKVVGKVHRVVSADGKTLTVHNSDGICRTCTQDKGSETLVYDKQ